MNKNNKLELINYIKRYGQGNAKPSPTAPVNPFDGGPSPQGRAYGSSPIKQMQDAIKRFANTVTNYQLDQQGLIRPNDPTKDFNDFLAEQYSAGSSIKGEEWDPSPAAKTVEAKRPTNIIELDNIMISLRRLGSQRNESDPDGVWEMRTQNGVKNVWAVADALVRVTEDFGYVSPNNSFTRYDLSELGNAIPKISSKEELGKLKDKDQRAKTIAPLVDKLTNFYLEYQRTILQHPAYRSYIDQTQPLFTVESGQEDPGAMPSQYANQAKQPEKLLLVAVRVPAGDGREMFLEQVAVSEFKDLESLQKLMYNRLRYTSQQVNDKMLQAKVVNALLKHVNEAPRGTSSEKNPSSKVGY